MVAIIVLNVITVQTLSILLTVLIALTVVTVRTVSIVLIVLNKFIPMVAQSMGKEMIASARGINAVQGIITR